jgi:hypothetical protein
MQLSDDSGNNGFARINLLEPTFSWMMKSWMRLQYIETRDLISGLSPSSNPCDGLDFALTYTGEGVVPRSQQELERMILFEEAKKYSVLAYKDLKGAPVFQLDNASISNINGRVTLSAQLVSDAFPETNETRNNQAWDTHIPVPTSPPEQLSKKSSNQEGISAIAQKSARDKEFLGFWHKKYVPGNADLQRPPSRISNRPRTALAISTDPNNDRPFFPSQPAASGRRSVSATPPLMPGRHSQRSQDAYNIKNMDLISNQRHIPHYLLPNSKEINTAENGVGHRLRSSSGGAEHLRGSVSRSQPLSERNLHHGNPPASFTIYLITRQLYNFLQPEMLPCLITNPVPMIAVISIDRMYEMK